MLLQIGCNRVVVKCWSVLEALLVVWQVVVVDRVGAGVVVEEAAAAAAAAQYFSKKCRIGVARNNPKLESFLIPSFLQTRE